MGTSATSGGEKQSATEIHFIRAARAASPYENAPEPNFSKYSYISLCFTWNIPQSELRSSYVMKKNVAAEMFALEMTYVH